MKAHKHNLDKIAIQKTVSRYIHISLYPDTMLYLIVKRLHTWFPLDKPFILEDTVAEVLRALRDLPCHVVMTTIKKYCNAPATTTRYHEDVIYTCIFGCVECQDTILHYMHCPRLWAAVSSRTTGAPSSNHLQRLGLLEDTEATLELRLRRLSVAYSVYHAIKITNTSMICQTNHTTNYNQDHINKLALTSKSHAAIAARLCKCVHIS